MEYGIGVEIKIFTHFTLTHVTLRPKGQAILAELSQKYKVLFQDQESLFAGKGRPAQKQTIITVQSEGLPAEELSAIRAKIELLVRNSFRPEDWGTLYFVSQVITRF